MSGGRGRVPCRHQSSDEFALRHRDCDPSIPSEGSIGCSGGRGERWRHGHDADPGPGRSLRRSRGGRRWMAVPILAVVIAAGACSDDAPSTDASTATTAPSESGEQTDFAGQVDIGDGRSIYMECRGTGSPTVVLVAGLGERVENWSMTTADPESSEGSLFPGVEGFTRVCAYDRPGTGGSETGPDASRSTPVAKAATIADSAEDLDALLTASGEAGPYVLLGHSLGGPIIRLYAPAHPDEVAGLVFDDALSENLADGLTLAAASGLRDLEQSRIAEPAGELGARSLRGGGHSNVERRCAFAGGADDHPHR